MPKNKKLALNSRIQTNQILTKDDEVCIPRLYSIPFAVKIHFIHKLAPVFPHSQRANILSAF